jgi:hypothetical protein
MAAHSAISKELFSSFTPVPIGRFLLSFPMAFFFFNFRRKLMKIVETHTTKQNLIFLTFGRELLNPHPPKKGNYVKGTVSPPLTFMPSSESAGVSALTNLHLFECDA